MISNIELKADNIIIPKSKVTILVGANNSGKTLFLNEVKNIMEQPYYTEKTTVINKIELEDYDRENILNLLKERSFIVEEDDNIIIDGKRVKTNDKNALRKALTKFIDANNRFSLVNGSRQTPQKESPKNALDIIYRMQSERIILRKKIFEAFGFYPSIEYTAGEIDIKISKDEPPNDVETSESGESITFHKQTKRILEQGNGVKAYFGIMTSIYIDIHNIILLDEPEAFLHPPLAYKLGQEIVACAHELNKQFFIATHNANFLMGCLESKQEINIIRLDYDNKSNTSGAKLLSNHFLKKLLSNPYIKHTTFMSALYYKFVIICEADADRVFYSEINQRLLDTKYGGIENCLFINSPNGKAQMYNFISGLKEFGVTYAAIVDFDIIKDGFDTILKASGIDQTTINRLQNYFVKKINDYCEKNSLDIKNNGLAILDEATNKIAHELLSELKKYGIFLVSCGELEYWLPELGVNPKDKSNWLNKIFSKMGENPNEQTYIKPEPNKDVWEFIISISNWFKIL